MKTSITEKKKLILRNEQEIGVIFLENLLAITVKDYLCTFVNENSDNFTCTKTLTEVEKQLPNNFIKISRNTIINADKIIGFNKK